MNIMFPAVNPVKKTQARPFHPAGSAFGGSSRPGLFSPVVKDSFVLRYSQGVKFSGGPQSVTGDDDQRINGLPPLLQQVMAKAKETAASTGAAEVKPQHALAAMVSLLDELSQWQVQPGRRAKTVSREQRETATGLANALMPGSGLAPMEVARQLRPLVTRLHQHVVFQNQVIPPQQLPLHSSLRGALDAMLSLDPGADDLGKRFVGEVLRREQDDMLSGLSRGARQRIEEAHLTPPVPPDLSDMDMDTDNDAGSSTQAPDLFDELKEKSPTLYKWVEMGSGNQKNRFFDQFQPGPLSSIVVKGVEMASREVAVNRKQRGNLKNAPTGRNLESLNALVPPEQRKKLDKAHLAGVLESAHRKLTALPRPTNETAVEQAAQQTRNILTSFMTEPGRMDFSIGAFVQFLRAKTNEEEMDIAPDVVPEAYTHVGRILSELAEEAQDKRLERMEQFEKTCPALMKNGTNLVRQGMQNRLPEVLMRREATDRMLAMINSGTNRTNLLLNAGSGEGKTYAVLGLAQRIAADDIPKEMQGTQMVQLDLGRMMGNAQFRGELEKVSKEVFDQLNRYLTDNPKRKVIVFMDEIHMLSGDDGAQLLDIMKSSGILEKKNLTFVGATTPEDWRKSSLRKDQAFLGRFHNLDLPPFSNEEKLTILGRNALQIQQDMGVEIQPELLESILKQASAKWPENAMRRAVDLMGLSASLATGTPLELSVLKDTLQRKELWLDTLQNQKTMKGRFVRQMSEIGREIKALKDEIGNSHVEPAKSGHAVVQDKHVRQALAILTGEKIGVLSQDELTRLRHSKDILSRHIVGQPEALSIIEEALREIAVRQISGDVQDKPIVSMLLPGPTGVGKTRVSEVIAKEFMDGNILRFDMSECSGEDGVNRLTGASPGYVGYDDGGLVDQVRKKPNSVIVFDEIEKAHPSVRNLLLQILDKGQLMDNQGQPVSFRNTIVILTSNLNNELITEQIRQHRREMNAPGAAAKDPQLAARELETQVRSLLTRNPEGERSAFRPEQLGRLDYVIPFSPLTQRNVSEILDIRLREMNQVSFLKDNNLEVHLSDRARKRLVDLSAACAQPGEDADALMRLGSLRLNEARINESKEELPLQGGARDVGNNFERFVRKKVLGDLIYDPRLVGIENARITVDYDPSSQSFRLQPIPLSTGDNALTYAERARKGASKTLGMG